MVIDVSHLCNQFIRGFEIEGSGYNPDFPEMFDTNRVMISDRMETISGIPHPTLPSAKWVPAVVAVHVGMSPQVVGKLLTRYGVEPHELQEFGYHNALGAYGEEVPEGFGLVAGLLAGFEAASTEPLQYDLGKKQHSVVRFALLHSELDTNWTVSRLNALRQAFKLGDAKPEDYLNLEDRDLFACNDVVPPFPNRNAIDFVKRSGLLHPEVAKKKFHLHEAWEVILVDWYTENDARWGELVESCLKKLIGEHRSAMTRAFQTVIPSLSRSAKNSPTDYIYIELKEKAIKLDAGDIFNNVVMQLNFFPTMPVVNKQYIAGTTHFYDLLNEPTTILSKVVSELSGADADDFALAHFTALGQISALGFVDQDLRDFDPNVFTLKVLEAYEAFSTPEGVYASDDKLKIDELAREGAKSLVSLLMRTHDFDHSTFRVLGSRGVSILASAGLDQSKLPRMTGRDLGRVFGEDLGL